LLVLDGSQFPWIITGVGVLFSSALIFVPRHFVTVDGALHVNVATVLREAVLDGLHPPLSTFLEWSPYPTPNLLADGLLAALTGAFEPTMAERVLIALYAAALPISLIYAVRGVARGAEWLALFALPLTFNLALVYGFYNFVFSIVAFLVVAGYVTRHADRLISRHVVVLGALLTATYFTHIVGFVEAVLLVSVVLGLRAFASRSGTTHRAIVYVGALGALGALGVAVFVAGSGSLQVDFESKPKEVVATLALIWGIWSYSAFEGLIALVLACTLVVLGIRATVARGRIAWRTGDELLVYTLIAFLAVVFAPSSVGSGSVLTQRLALFPALGFLLWLAGQPLSSRSLARAGLVFAAAALALGLVRMPTASYLSRTVADVMTAVPCVAGRSSLIQATLSLPNGSGWRVDPLSDEVSRIAAHTGGIDVGTSAWAVPFFVLRSRQRVDPYEHLVPDGFSQISPPPFDIERYERRTGARIDYVVVMGRTRAEPEILESADWRRLRRQLITSYRLVHHSPGGWIDVWEHRAPAVATAGAARRALSPGDCTTAS